MEVKTLIVIAGKVQIRSRSTIFRIHSNGQPPRQRNTVLWRLTTPCCDTLPIGEMFPYTTVCTAGGWDSIQMAARRDDRSNWFGNERIKWSIPSDIIILIYRSSAISHDLHSITAHDNFRSSFSSSSSLSSSSSPPPSVCHCLCWITLNSGRVPITNPPINHNPWPRSRLMRNPLSERPICNWPTKEPAFVSPPPPPPSPDDTVTNF